jgi:hypothetical protein
MRLLCRLILLMVLACLILSCGARKSEMQIAIEKQNLDVKQETEYTIEADIQKNTVQYSESDELEFIPVDPDKPIEFTGPDGKTQSVKNATVKKKSGKQALQSHETIKQKESGKQKTDLKADSYKKNKEKATERKAGYGWLWLLLIPFIGYIIYRVWKKYTPMV